MYPHILKLHNSFANPIKYYLMDLLKNKYVHFLLLFLTFSFNQTFAADPITTYTVQQTNGTCLSNASITISFPTPPSGSYENGWTAELTSVNNQPQLLSIPTNGSSISFNNLTAGNYSLKLTNGISTLTYASNPIAITTSYVAIQPTVSSVKPTCPPSTLNAQPNGTITLNVPTGGVGPFEYIVTSTTGTQSVQTAQRTHTFMNMIGGESVNYTVTDRGCNASISSTHRITENTDPNLSFSFAPFNFIRGENCNANLLYVNLTSTSTVGNRLNSLTTPGNATVTINGQNYNLSYAGLVWGYFQFNHRFIYDPVQTNGPNLVHNTPFTVNLNWGCQTLSQTDTYKMDDTFLSVSGSALMNSSCVIDYRINVGASEGYHVYWQRNAAVVIDKEEVNGGTTSYTNVHTGSLTIPAYNSTILLSSISSVAVNGPGRYRVTVSDNCHTVEKFVNVTAPTSYPIDNVAITPTSSILAGTVGYNLVFNTTTALTYPISVKTERTDGQTSFSLNPSQPLSLAKPYTFSLPHQRTFNSYPGSIVDLPPGRYKITINDACSTTTGRSRIVEIDLIGGASYNPQLNISNGCINSNSISYQLNRNNFAFNPSSVELRRINTDGSDGTLISTQAFSTSPQNVNNLSSGAYRLIYRNAGTTGYSIARDTLLPSSYFHDFTIQDYKNIDIDISTQFCDPVNTNSGIVSVEVTSGTLVYPLTISLYSSSTPNSPLRGPVTINSPNKGTVFTNLSAGDYFIRTTSSCYSFDKTFSLNTTSTLPQAKVSEGFVCPGSPTTVAVISATNNLYDITWVIKNNGTEQVVGTGMPINFTPNQTTTYTAKYQLKSTFNCPNPILYESDVTVNVTSNPDLSSPKVTDIELCKNNTPTVTISNTENNFIYEILNASNQSFNPKVTGTGNGGNLSLNIPLPLNPGQLKVTTTNGNGGCKGTLIDEIKVIKSTPSQSIAVEGSYTCTPSDGTITLKQSENGITYTLLKNGNPLSPNISTTGNGNDITITVPSIHLTSNSNEFTIKTSGSGCSDGSLTNKGIITVQQAPVISSINHPFCDGTKGSFALNTFGGSGNYQYSLDNTNWTNNQTFTNLNAGNYTFYSRDINNNSCTTQGTIQLIENCFEFTKTSTTNPNFYTNVGDILTYNLTVKNTGTSTLTNIQIADPIATVATSTIASIAPGASVTVTASYTVTQADVTSGSVKNKASATLGTIVKHDSVTILKQINLPATGLLLKGYWDNKNSVLLEWSTTSEQNTSYFVIERSTDGILFNPLPKHISAAGNSTNKSTYMYKDENTSSLSTIFYRLKLYDKDLSYRYSNTIFLRKGNTENIRVYPNPATDNINIQFNRSGTYEIYLYGNNGQLIKNINNIDVSIFKQLKIERGTLSNGTYILRVIQKQTNQIDHFKIVLIN